MYNGYGFGSLVNQNNVNTNYSSHVPTMPGYAGIDKLEFADMRSPQDQIHWLYLYALQLSQEFITREEAQALIDAATEAMKAYSDAQDAKQDAAFKQDQARQDADMLKRYYYLLDLINETGKFNGSCFDPTIGYPRNIKRVLERVYDFDRVFALTAGDHDEDYKLTAAAFDGFGTTARDYDVNFALVHYNDSRKTVTTTPQSTYFVRMLKRMVGGGEGSILTFNAPLEQDGENITLSVDDSLNVENDALGVNAEKPISTDGGAVSLAHDETLKVADGRLGVAPATEDTLGGVIVGSGLAADEGMIWVTLAQPGTPTSGGVKLAAAPTISEYGSDPYAPVRLTDANDLITVGLGAGLVRDSNYNIAAAPATATTIGGVKIGEGIDVAKDGTISANAGSEVNVIAPLVADDAAQELSGDGYSLAIGLGASAGTEDGKNAVSIGAYSSAVGGNALSVGNYCHAYSRAGGVALGNTCETGTEDGGGGTAIAIGDGVFVTADSSVVIGFNMEIAAANAIMLGEGEIKPDYAIAIGTNASVAESATGSIALGRNTGVAKNCLNSVALGASSKATAAYEISVGDSATDLHRRIANVSTPVYSADAATKGYVDDAAVKVVSATGFYDAGTGGGLDTANSYMAVTPVNGFYIPLHGSFEFTCPTGGFSGIVTDLEATAVDTRNIYAMCFIPSEASEDSGGSVVRHVFHLALHDGKLALEVVNSPFTAVSEMPITITF